MKWLLTEGGRLGEVVAMRESTVLCYLFGKRKSTKIFQVMKDIMPEVNRLIGKHLFPSVGPNMWFAEILL